MNPIGHEGIAAIIKTITVNPRLKLVGLEGCMVDLYLLINFKYQITSNNQLLITVVVEYNYYTY